MVAVLSGRLPVDGSTLRRCDRTALCNRWALPKNTGSLSERSPIGRGMITEAATLVHHACWFDRTPPFPSPPRRRAQSGQDHRRRASGETTSEC